MNRGEDAPRFEVAVYGQVRKRIKKLPAKHRNQVLRRIADLETDPRPHDSIKLKGGFLGFRIDIGEYRILYEIDRDARMVDVRRLLQRGEGYRRHR